jgi:hypothetical protein
MWLLWNLGIYDFQTNPKPGRFTHQQSDLFHSQTEQITVQSTARRIATQETENPAVIALKLRRWEINMSNSYKTHL